MSTPMVFTEMHEKLLGAEMCAEIRLREQNSTICYPELIEAALQKFFDFRVTDRTEEFKDTRHLTLTSAKAWNWCRLSPHGWTHSLSHFTEKLWERRMVGWIKKFNQTAFFGANDLEDPSCSERLILDFAKYGKWDDDPADFHITPENIGWMDWRYQEKTRLRIEHGPFESEEAFLKWKAENS
ncbi:hypothetical protein HY734_01670 [Candidatus Uhrbacteria bacterium]|nr:hypothetical protein [Candidatus Uhrbacteria bacterium]